MAPDGSIDKSIFFGKGNRALRRGKIAADIHNQTDIVIFQIGKDFFTVIIKAAVIQMRMRIKKHIHLQMKTYGR